MNSHSKKKCTSQQWLGCHAASAVLYSPRTAGEMLVPTGAGSEGTSKQWWQRWLVFFNMWLLIGSVTGYEVAEEPGTCIPSCYHLHLTKKIFPPLSLRASWPALKQTHFSFPFGLVLFLFMQVPSLFWFGLGFFPLCKRQVSFGLSLLTNSRELYLLPRASPCSYTLLMSVFIPHGHIHSQLLSAYCLFSFCLTPCSGLGE